MVAITVCPSPHVRSARPGGVLVPMASRRQPTGIGIGAGRVLTSILVLVVILAVGYLVTAPALDTSGAIPVQDTVHVVSSGETMWSIAGAVAPAGEVGPYVERLVEVNGTAAPAPGQVLELPVP